PPHLPLLPNSCKRSSGVCVHDLIAKGHKAKTGYWAQKDGGMMLRHSQSTKHQAIVALDPLVQNDCVHYKLYEWKIVVE
ncbi:hypothetical protein, partial [Brasilonema sp. UFV-L1]|uniref:hypothetical protein n=1 Tax=Brasilonema sp. UFV-L1 TaxID=2234130 RepID=UPI00145D2B9C